MITKTLVVIRDGVRVLYLPHADIRDNGTIWHNGIPLLDCRAPGAIPKDRAAVAVKAKCWSDIPASMYARLGTSPSGLIVRDDAELRAEAHIAAEQARREYDATHPGASERREIEALYARAIRRRDADDDSNTMDYYRLTAEADADLKEWRVKYSAEARQEDASDLRAKADHQRELASGALAYDADGSLTSEMQYQRHDGCMARAAELEKQAAKLLAAK